MAAREGRLNGCRLFGVALLSRGNSSGFTGVPGVSVLRFRDIGALVQQATYSRATSAQLDLDGHRKVIDRAFLAGTVLPAPCGTLFRGTEHVRRWLEQNYIALNEGIHFVAGRCEARVHISLRTEAMLPAAGTDFGEAEAAAAECFRLLRRDAVATVALPPRSRAALLSAAFLVQQDRWGEFAEQVREQALRRSEFVLEQTGPWPPYDFVRMDFGA
jgi:hypothetical protein